MIMKIKVLFFIVILVTACSGNRESGNNNIKKTYVSNDLTPISPLNDGEVFLMTPLLERL